MLRALELRRGEKSLEGGTFSFELMALWRVVSCIFILQSIWKIIKAEFSLKIAHECQPRVSEPAK